MNTVAETVWDDGSVSQVRVTSQDQCTERERTVLRSLTKRYENRGFSQAARNDVKQWERKERKEADRMLREDCAGGKRAEGEEKSYCHESYLGRTVMGVEDFTAYFRECRRGCSSEVRQDDGMPPQSTVVPARTRQEALANRRARMMSDPSGKKKNALAAQGGRLLREWIFTGEPIAAKGGKKKRMPLSTIAVLVVLTVSLVMIVFSSVLVSLESGNVSQLSGEVRDLEGEETLTRDKLEAQIDYLEVYRRATEELGMISADAVDGACVTARAENTVESFDTHDEVEFSFSTLLSAIGIRSGR